MLGLHRVDRDQSFFALGGNSLLAVRLIAEVEAELGRELPLASVFGQGATVSGMAALLAEPGRPASAGSSLLTPVRQEGSQPPLFVIEPNQGPLVALRHFLPHLDAEQPVLAMLPRTDGGRFDREGSIEALAEELLGALRESRPHGPYRLAGYSLGGILAYHLAARLREEGEEVQFLGLMDTMTPEVALRHSEPGISFTTRLRRLVMTSPRRWPAMLWSAVRREAGVPAAAWAPDVDGDFDAEGAADLLRRYRVPPCGAPLTVFATRWNQRWTRDPSLGWAGVHRGPLAVVPVAGDHRTMLLQPRVDDLAAGFARRLGEGRW